MAFLIVCTTLHPWNVSWNIEMQVEKLKHNADSKSFEDVKNIAYPLKYEWLVFYRIQLAHSYYIIPKYP